MKEPTHQEHVGLYQFIIICYVEHDNVNACLPTLMYTLEVVHVSTVLGNKVNKCWFLVLARLFHVSNNSVIDSICYYTGILLQDIILT